MAHEEPAGEVVGMMAGLGNPAVIGCQQVTDLGHYAHAVGAGNYQTKGSHQVSLQSPVLRRCPDQGAVEPMADRKPRILLAPEENFSNRRARPAPTRHKWNCRSEERRVGNECRTHAWRTQSKA